MIVATESAAIQSTQTHGISGGLSDKEQSTVTGYCNGAGPSAQDHCSVRERLGQCVYQRAALDRTEWAIVKAQLDLV